MSASNNNNNIYHSRNYSKISTEISNDYDLYENAGYTFTISDKLLGHGSYGSVYLATNENGKQLAVKCCDMSDTGIPNILEASIMASISHPYINNAIRIQASSNKLYIIQDLAKTDLAQYTRREKGNYKPSIEELRNWCFHLAQAVLVLHKEGIIHADIKASNILLYDDGSIKLSDFTLATKKWNSSELFSHNVCTCTHRPLECLMKRSWNESLDIWSLGCTFYEIAYGESLFPYQGVFENNQKIKNKDSKLRLRNRSINAIIDWSSRGPNAPTSYEVIGITQYPIDYLPFKLCNEFNKPDMAIFNNLICKMLTVDPKCRPTISEIVSHPFFSDLKPPIYLSIYRPINKISAQEQARVIRYIERYTSNDNIKHLAFAIYCRCNKLDDVNEHIRSATCTWIASKVVVGYPPETGLPIHQLLSTERSICHNLGFRIHSL